MGLFDTVICEQALPELGYTDLDFQTKDLLCALYTFIITADGKLLIKDGRSEACEYNDIDGFKFHGRFFFYRNIDSVWYEYVATFTHGQLEDIKLYKKESL
ncbi:MAG: hypothetical protein QW136_01715 [Nitrososphaerales archaeon]